MPLLLFSGDVKPSLALRLAVAGHDCRSHAIVTGREAKSELTAPETAIALSSYVQLLLVSGLWAGTGHDVQ